MGSRRRRRFIVPDDNNDSAGEAPQVDPSGGNGSVRTPEELEKSRYGREEVMRRDGKEELPEETPSQISRRRKNCRRRMLQRGARESNNDLEDEAGKKKHPEQQQVEDVMDQADTAAAVPIGDPISVTGRRGMKQRKHYASFQYNGLTFDLEDSVLVTPEHSDKKPYAAIIKGIAEAKGKLFVTAKWFYRPEEAEIGEGRFCIACDTRELFYSSHVDDVPAESVMHNCIVHFIPQNKQFPARKKYPGFIVQKAYAAVEKKLWNLTDNGYEGHEKQEIEILLKKTKDRIGVLPDIQPEEDAPRDSTGQLSKESLPANKNVNPENIIGELPAATSENIEKAETPHDCTTDRFANKGTLHNEDVNPLDITREPPDRKSKDIENSDTPASDKLKNYAILARYKAITGNKHRDKWLDKLLESIPLAWSKEITAQDNEKPYGIGDVVSTIVSLERSAYEALGTDCRKYNQKLRHLWYHIKNSSKLRIRLMNKELDPPALLTMSPDELMVGLISAVKISEPQQPNQLQLECSSCSHMGFSSFDVVSQLRVDGPSTAAVTANVAAAGTTTAGQPTS